MFRNRMASAFVALSCGVALVHGQNEPDQTLAAIREYALHYAQSLPDYTCTRVTQQKVSYVIMIYAENPELFGQHPQDMPSWTNVIEEELIVAGKRESHKVLKRDSPPPRLEGQLPPVVSTISVAEFGSVLARIFEPGTGTSFHWARSGKLRGRPVIEFSFEVPRAHGASVYDNVAKPGIVLGYQASSTSTPRAQLCCASRRTAPIFPGIPNSGAWILRSIIRPRR